MTGDIGGRAPPEEKIRAQAATGIWWVIFFSLVFRIAFAASISLGVDETYMAVAGRELHLSYFDHPPLSWWMTWAAHHLFGSIAPLALRLPFILLFSVSTWLIYRLTSLLYTERAGLWAAIVLCISPVFGVAFGSMILPDGPLMAAMLATGLCLTKLFFVPDKPAALYWAGAGFFGGLALLSKYQGIFIFAGTFFFLLTVKQQRGQLLRPWPYLGLAIAIVVFSPVLVWNAQHDWVSFAFQGNRATFSRIDPSRALTAIAGQAIYLAPWIWVPIVIATFHALRRGPSDGRSWLPVCLGIGPVIAFSLIPTWSTARILPHWAAPGYLMLIPLLGSSIARYEADPAHRTQLLVWFRGSIIFLLLASLLVATELHLGWIERIIPQFVAKKDPAKELLDWRDLRTALKERGFLDKRHLFVLAPRWQQAARAAYALDGKLPVLCMSTDPREFNVIDDPIAHDKEDALIIGADLSLDEVNQLYGPAFEHISPLPPITINHAGHPVITLDVFYGTRFDGHVLKHGWLK